MENHEYLKIKNCRGEVYVLHPNYDEFAVIDVEGLGLPDIENTYTDSIGDGGTINNSRLRSRSLVIWLVMFGNNEVNRKKFYRMFPLKTEIEIYYKNAEYNVSTVARIDTADMTHFKGKERIRIGLTCADPYLYDIASIHTQLKHDDTVTVKNDGDVATGFTAEISVQTDETPSLTILTEAITLEDMLKYNFHLFDDVSYDVEDNTLYIKVNGLNVSPENYITGYLVRSQTQEPYIKFNTARKIGDTISATIYSAGDRQTTDLQRVTGDVQTSVVPSSMSDVHRVTFEVPSWFDEEEDSYTLQSVYESGTLIRDISISEAIKIERDGDNLSFYFPYESPISPSFSYDWVQITIPVPEAHWTDYEDESDILPQESGTINVAYIATAYTPETFTLSDVYTLEYKKYKSDETWLPLQSEWIDEGYPQIISDRYVTVDLSVPANTLPTWDEIYYELAKPQMRFKTKNKDDYKRKSESELVHFYLTADIRIITGYWTPQVDPQDGHLYDNVSVYTLTESGGEVIDDITDICEFSLSTYASGNKYITARFPKGELEIGSYVRMVVWHSDTYNSGDISGIPHTDFAEQNASIDVGFPHEAPCSMLTYHSDRDRRTAYVDGEKINATIENVALDSPCWLVRYSEYITNTLTVEVISSTNGDDVRLYTDREVDEGLCYVDGLTLSNETTGKSIKFASTKFRDGDTIEISTVPGNLYATVTASTWIPVGTSLIADVIRNGTFFKLEVGSNALELSADINSDYLSGSVSAKKMRGGV